MFTPPYECGSCRSTKLRLDKFGIDYEAVEADDAMADQLRREGYSAFPVVKVDLGDGAEWSWAGYRHDEIGKLATLFSG